MKRAIVAILVGGLVFGGVFGLAAGLNVSSDTLGSGTTVVAACQSGVLTATYATSYDATAAAHKVTGVTWTGLQSGCFSKAYKVSLTGNAGAVLGEVNGTTPASGSSFTVDFGSASPAVQAAALQGTHLLITG